MDDSIRPLRAKELLRIDDLYAETTCKIGQGAACCRYLSMGGGGWSCLKHSDLKPYLDDRVAKGTMNAQADNCEGRAE